MITFTHVYIRLASLGSQIFIQVHIFLSTLWHSLGAASESKRSFNVTGGSCGKAAFRSVSVRGQFMSTCSSVCTSPQLQVRWSRGVLLHLPVSIFSRWKPSRIRVSAMRWCSEMAGFVYAASTSSVVRLHVYSDASLSGVGIAIGTRALETD